MFPPRKELGATGQEQGLEMKRAKIQKVVIRFIITIKLQRLHPHRQPESVAKKEEEKKEEEEEKNKNSIKGKKR